MKIKSYPHCRSLPWSFPHLPKDKFYFHTCLHISVLSVSDLAFFFSLSLVFFRFTLLYLDEDFILYILLSICWSSWSWSLVSFNISGKLSVIRRRQWHPTPVLLPGESHGWRSLVGCSPWGCEESDVTERLHFHFSFSCIGEGNSSPLQCSYLENPRDGGAWWAAVYGVAQSQTRLKWLSSSSSSSVINFSTVASSSFLHSRQFGEYYNFLPCILYLNLYSILFIFVSLSYIFNLLVHWFLLQQCWIYCLIVHWVLTYLSMKFYLFFFQICLTIC